MSARYGSAVDRFWRQVDKSGECWLWMGAISRDGYGRFRTTSNRREPCKRTHAHRFAYEIARGVVPDGLVVRHMCNNPPCVRPDHLAVGTQADNIADKVAADRQARGDRNGSRLHPERLRRGESATQSRLTATQVSEIRARYVPRSVGYQRLATEYGVSMATVHEIIKRKIWRHLP